MHPYYLVSHSIEASLQFLITLCVKNLFFYNKLYTTAALLIISLCIYVAKPIKTHASLHGKKNALMLRSQHI
jgi:hypothetical protein